MLPDAPKGKPHRDETRPNKDPLFRWCSTIESLTKLKRDTHVRKAYVALLAALNQKEFNGNLLNSENATLIVPRPKSRIEGPPANQVDNSRNISQQLVTEQSSVIEKSLTQEEEGSAGRSDALLALEEFSEDEI